MLLPLDLKVYLTSAPVDMRKSYQTLGVLVKSVLHKDPFCGHLCTTAERNIHEGLTVFDFPECHQKRLRTSNVCERLNKEIKRRTRVATLFPNEASCLRLVTAVAMEVSEGWITGKAYLSKEE